MGDDDIREVAQLAAEEVSRQWSRVSACLERAEPGYVESLPEEVAYLPTPDGRVMFRFELGVGGVIVCEASRCRVVRASFSDDETEVEIFNHAGRRIDTFTQPGTDFDPTLN